MILAARLNDAHMILIYWDRRFCAIASCTKLVHNENSSIWFFFVRTIRPDGKFRVAPFVVKTFQIQILISWKHRLEQWVRAKHAAENRQLCPSLRSRKKI